MSGSRSYNYQNIQNIRTLLTEGFNEDELRRFCFEEPHFRPVYNQLARNEGKAQIVDSLIQYAYQKELFDLLLTWARKNNLRRYQKHQPYLQTSTKRIKDKYITPNLFVKLLVIVLIILVPVILVKSELPRSLAAPMEEVKLKQSCLLQTKSIPVNMPLSPSDSHNSTVNGQNSSCKIVKLVRAYNFSTGTFILVVSLSCPINTKNANSFPNHHFKELACAGCH